MKIGDLRTDICWVIENPAFFDNNSAVSTKLFQMLIEWDDLGVNCSSDERIELAETITQEFKEAKANSEKLGFNYLQGKDQKKLQTASKLAHKAESTQSVEEKSILFEKVAEILVQVVAVTLPIEMTKAIEAKIFKGLETSLVS